MSQFKPPQPHTYPVPRTQPYPLRPSPRRPRGILVFVGVVALVVILLSLTVFMGQAKTPVPSRATPIVYASLTAESNAVNTADANASAQLAAEAITPTTPPVTPTPQPSPSVVFTQDIGSWVVTLNKVYRATSGPYASSKAGDIFVVVDVTAINEAATSELISSGALFVFQDETGQAYNETISGIGVPPDGTVPAGGKLRGQIVYAVPASLHTFTLEFQDNLYNGNTGTWSFSV
jgi:Domain of unknown function (DUF4352)